MLTFLFGFVLGLICAEVFTFVALAFVSMGKER
jgi:hypothetical protein